MLRAALEHHANEQQLYSSFIINRRMYEQAKHELVIDFLLWVFRRRKSRVGRPVSTYIHQLGRDIVYLKNTNPQYKGEMSGVMSKF